MYGRGRQVSLASGQKKLPLDGGPEHSQRIIKKCVDKKHNYNAWQTVTVSFVTGSELLLCVHTCSRTVTKAVSGRVAYVSGVERQQLSLLAPII